MLVLHSNSGLVKGGRKVGVVASTTGHIRLRTIAAFKKFNFGRLELLWQGAVVGVDSDALGIWGLGGSLSGSLVVSHGSLFSVSENY